MWRNTVQDIGCIAIVGMIIRSRRNPLNVRLADWPWTPFGVCTNLLRDQWSCRRYHFKVSSIENLNIVTDIRVFPRTFDYFSTVWFYVNHASPQNANLQKHINISKGKTEKWRKSNLSKNHLSIAYLKNNTKINCVVIDIQWQIEIIKSGQMLPHCRWYGPDRLPMEVRSKHDETYELFLSLRTEKSLHFWTVLRKVPVGS